MGSGTSCEKVHAIRSTDIIAKKITWNGADFVVLCDVDGDIVKFLIVAEDNYIETYNRLQIGKSHNITYREHRTDGIITARSIIDIRDTTVHQNTSKVLGFLEIGKEVATLCEWVEIVMESKTVGRRIICAVETSRDITPGCIYNILYQRVFCGPWYRLVSYREIGSDDSVSFCITPRNLSDNVS